MTPIRAAYLLFLIQTHPNWDDWEYHIKFIDTYLRIFNSCGSSVQKIHTEMVVGLARTQISPDLTPGPYPIRFRPSPVPRTGQGSATGIAGAKP